MRVQPVEFEWVEVDTVDQHGEVRRRKAMLPLRRYDNICGRQFVDGEVYAMTPVESRSMRSHRHYFAALKSGYDSLPETMCARWPNVEHFRHWLLIATGWCEENEIECENELYAKRLVTFVRKENPYARIHVRATKVLIRTAKSQSLSAMGADDFQKSKKDVLDLAEGLLGVPLGTLMKEGDKAA